MTGWSESIAACWWQGRRFHLSSRVPLPANVLMIPLETETLRIRSFIVVAKIKISLGIYANTTRQAELCFGCRSAIAPEECSLSISRNRVDDSCRRRYFAKAVVPMPLK